MTIPDNLSHWLTCAYLSFYFTALVAFGLVGIVGLLLMGEGSARMVAHRLRAVRCVTLKSGRVSRLVRS